MLFTPNDALANVRQGKLLGKTKEERAELDALRDLGLGNRVFASGPLVNAGEFSVRDKPAPVQVGGAVPAAAPAAMPAAAPAAILAATPVAAAAPAAEPTSVSAAPTGVAAAPATAPAAVPPPAPAPDAAAVSAPAEPEPALPELSAVADDNSAVGAAPTADPPAA